MGSETPTTQIKEFLRELKRRRVYTVAVVYAAVAWLLLQVASILFPTFGAPPWVMQVFTVFLVLGFPAALVLSWAFDLTPAGVVRTDAAAPADLPAASVPTELPGGPSIAVLPLRNLSGDPAQDLFAEALTGDIISGLAQSSHLFVLASGAASEADSRDPDVIGLGHRLKVDYLLRGSVRKSGEQLRVAVQLMNTGNGVELWSQNYDRQLSAASLFAVQDDIRQQIVATLSDLHGVIYSRQTEQNVRRPTDSLNAYECLSVALAYDKYISEENHLKARESLERAITIDPEYDEAWAHLSWIYTDEYVYDYNPQPDPMPRALEAARKAIRLAPRNYHNRWLLARVHYFMDDREQFLAESRRALQLNANDGTTLGLIGIYTAWCGLWDEGMAMMDKARQLNPNFPDYYHLAAGMAEFARGNYLVARNEMLKADLPEWLLTHVLLAATLGRLDQPEQAGPHLQALEQLSPGFGLDDARAFLRKMFPYLDDMNADVLRGLSAAGLKAGS
jgi:adenylate cyclase